MKHLLLSVTLLFWLHLAHGQHISVQGTVLDAPSGNPLIGVTVLIMGTTNGTITDSDGHFRITCLPDDRLLISYIGYRPAEIPVNNRTSFTVYLEEDTELLQAVEVYSTGYQQVPPDRTTGSFAQVDQQLIQRSTSTDIISRLESITPGLLFDKRPASDVSGMDQRALRIRGVNSIESDNSPLIVVDNFPYEGDLSGINPNDVASITILRDAAAASIWGARAANGVIVITMKQGRSGQPLTVNLRTNVTFADQPDLHDSPAFIPAADYIGLETELFNRGFYTSTENSSAKPALSPVIELLIQQRDGLISSDQLNAALQELGRHDVRDEMEHYFFRQSIMQQYALNISGGSDKTSHYLSAGYDHNAAAIDGNDLSRFTCMSNNTFQPVKPLRISLGIMLTGQKQSTNGATWGSIGTDLPYNTFADASGKWLPVTNTLRSTYLDEKTASGLLDWQYRPLQEKALKDITSRVSDYRISTGLSYDFLHHFQIDLKYQFQQMDTRYRNLQSKDSYAVRNEVNRFTQSDGTSPFPYGDILTQRFTEQNAHAARVQLNFNKATQLHNFAALAGIEARQVHAQGYGMQVYGYDDQVLTYTSQLDYTTRYTILPRGSAYLPQPASSLSDMIDRYLSYFANGSYTFLGRYSFSASARYDASNLFGVKTNQKGVPLWSAGTSWVLSDEPFYQVAFLPYMRLRFTYGYNGNINKSVTAYPTATYSTDIETGLPTAILKTPGNPQLRWEKIRMINVGLDFQSPDDRVTGTFEFYNKHGHDIIGEAPLDPTSGSGNMTNQINYAETRTSGIDFQINTINIAKPFKWTSNLLLSFTSNKILNFYNESITNTTIRSGLSLNSSVLPQEGKPIDALYSIPWWGLDPDTGNPLIEIEGELVQDYRTYARNLALEDLTLQGVSVAPVFGSVRNNFSWKGFTLSLNISFKAGYYFRKSGLSYYDLFNYRDLHQDYLHRWQQPGDEKHTNVPSMPATADSYRDFVYTASELMIEKGDHIRWEDLNLSYTFSGLDKQLPFRQVQLFAYTRNVAMLWQASKTGLDPDYPNASYKVPRSFSIGLNATF